MKKRCSLTCCFVLIITFLSFLPVTSSASEVQSSGQTTASLTLSGWGDVPKPKPDIPEGPQGNSSLKPTGKLPQTSEQATPYLTLVGWLLIGISLGYKYYNGKNYQKAGEWK